MIISSFGFQVNIGDQRSSKFDIISSDIDRGVYVLCDGANSTPWGGDAARICASSIISSLGTDSSIESITTTKAYANADALVKKHFNNAACTSISVKIESTGIELASCGDSLIEVFKFIPILGWKKFHQTQLDLLEDQISPSQLIGSETYDKPNLYVLPPKGTFAILLMSDGLYQFTSSNVRKKNISKIGGLVPSNEDLTFLSSKLASEAIRCQSPDDISIGIIWVKFK